MSFSSLQLHPDLERGVRELGYANPTPIQTQAVPAALEGRDVLACAMTGSGKTAAFALPILQRLMAKPRGTTRCLVLAPTRELAAQVQEQFEQLGQHTPVTSAAVFGGVGMGPQEHAFRSGVDVIVATPGRLLDHLKEPYARLDKVEILVLDEADRMLDMGFLPDIKRVLSHVPKQRQTLFFSATMPAPILELTRQMLKDPVSVDLERKAAPATGITQAVYPVSESLKSKLLLALLERGVMQQALVFTRTKHRANRLAEVLAKANVPSARIHGNRSQAQRTDALDGFKDGRYKVLVATDIAARGIDVEALGHVLNFDVPGLSEDYIHRVGRTGRASATGEAFTFVSPEEEGDLRAIERAIAKRLPRVTLPDFDYSAQVKERFEVPIAERIAEIRKRKAEERARAKEKAERRAQRETEEASRPAGGSRGGRRGGGGGGGRAAQGAGSGAPARGPARGPARTSSGAPSRAGAAPGESAGAGAGPSSGEPGRRRRRGGRGRGAAGGARPGSKPRSDDPYRD